MNLGDIYLKTFLVLTTMALVLSCLLALVLSRLVASLLRFRRRVSWADVLCFGFLLGCFVAFTANMLLHRPLFVAWHKAQNDAVPTTGCLTYDPHFTRLYATYQMTRTEFDTWVANHPWELRPGDNGLLHHDGPEFDLGEPDASFETEMAPNGRQLRVYFKSGIMYVSYSSM